ncbi:hypothetical protein ACFYZ5_42240 [Streptomyces chartreusis]|uniref:hypothetical protein n=1 Tax=Streptomyces chartreusis TaxID=1969 RepID=UPI0036CFAD3A
MRIGLTGLVCACHRASLAHPASRPDGAPGVGVSGYSCRRTGAALRAHTQSLDLLALSGRLLLVGNASGDCDHRIDGNGIWEGNIAVTGFNVGGYVLAHPEAVQPAAETTLKAVAGALANTEIEILPLADTATAHERLENHANRRPHRPHPMRGNFTRC